MLRADSVKLIRIFMKLAAIIMEQITMLQITLNYLSTPGAILTNLAIVIASCVVSHKYTSAVARVSINTSFTADTIIDR